MLPDYLVIDGIEVISTPRAAAYGTIYGECNAAVGACWDCTPESGLWLNMGEPYAGVTRDAPWYDPAIPESAHVTGIVGYEISGITDAVRASGSSRTEAVRREMTITFVVSLTSECAVSYIQGWLANVFAPSPCATGCVGHEVCMLACCPDVNDDGELVGPDPMRTMTQVEVVSGPTLTDRSWDPDDFELEYEVTLATPNVWVYRAPPPERRWTVRPSDGDLVTLDLPAVYAECPDDDQCAVAMACQSPDFAPLPSEPFPECYPVEPFAAHRTVISIPPGELPTGLDVIPVIRATAGQLPMRNMVIRFYANPVGLPCDRLPGLNPCRACTDLTTPEVPAGGSIVLDGRTGLNTITCTNSLGRDVQLPAEVFGPPIEGAGAGYVEPIQCGPGLCIEVYTAVGVSAGAEIAIEFWTRANGG